jgi:hypothetical protein
MNKLIKELAEEAELNATLLFNKEKLERFADLIILECAKIVASARAKVHKLNKMAHVVYADFDVHELLAVELST